MADVKWVKLTVNMFDNRKIKHLRKLPDGNNIVLIWVMLLTMAGRCNAGGMIFLTENIPYTTKMLADELDFEENTVALALNALEQFNMIVTDNGYFTIAGWEEYQNIEGMEKIREQNRLRQQKWYDKQKALQAPNVIPNVRLTQPNAIDIDKEEDIKTKIKEKEKKEKTSPKETNTTLFERIYLDYCLSENLISKLREWMKYKSERKDEYAEQGLRTLLRRIENKYLEFHKQDQTICELIDESMSNLWKGIIFDRLKAPAQTETKGSFETDEFFELAMKKSYAKNPRSALERQAVERMETKKDTQAVSEERLEALKQRLAR